MFASSLALYRENGAYVFLSTLAGRPGRWVRNRMLAHTLGVNKVNIGRGARLRGLAWVTMGEDFGAGDGLWLEAIPRLGNQTFTPQLRIGKHVRVSHWSHITCNHSITIGDHVLIGSKVLIADHNHGSFGARGALPDSPLIPPAERPLENHRFVTIEDNVWLGDGVVVCPDVTMGKGSVAGANSVVTTDVPPYTLVAGVPARPLRRYDAALKSWIKI